MIKIRECGEPLVELRRYVPDFVNGIRAKRLKKEGAVYLRKTVAEKLCEARMLLPEGVAFYIDDAWRPPHIQKELFDGFLKKWKKRFPSLTEKIIIQKIKKYVSPYDGKYVSGHITGGAVDIGLVKNGRRLPMWSHKLSYEENAASGQKKLPEHIRKNRKILFDALKNVGMENYSKEYWHWSYGDIFWARMNKKKTAIYGAAEIK
jgi:D-alanyl-D-alanine dipeptidase